MKEILSDIQVASEYYSISMKFLRKGNNLIGTQSRNRFTPTVTVIIIFGIISMMGDVVYETARSANSQYLNLLTISAAQVGLIFGAHETVMRSAIADITPFNKRGTFNTSYGLALLGGAALMGLLYDVNKIEIIIIMFACITELTAILLYFKMNSMVKNSIG